MSQSEDIARLTALFELMRVDKAAEKADALLRSYASLAILLGVSAQTLTEFGLTRDQALLLGCLSGLERRARRDQIDPSVPISTFSRAADCARAVYPGLSREQTALICLDKDCRLLAIRLLDGGADIAVGALMRVLTETQSDALVLCRNRPGGAAVFSDADVESAKAAMRLLRSLNVALLDRLLYTDEQVISLRAAGCIDEAQWVSTGTAQIPCRDWFAR